MNDPWDVKSVRQSGQYLSCMKINGVPLLPPVLSKECHKEMQYYKLLAKEVEKRIALLKPYTINSDTEESDDITDAPDLPESEKICEMPDANSDSTSPEKSITESPRACIVTIQRSILEYNSKIPNLKHGDPPNSIMNVTSDLIGPKNNSEIKESPLHYPSTEVPERDYNSPKKIMEKEILTDIDVVTPISNKKALKETMNSLVDKILCDPFHELSLNQDGPPSLSSKSFTGSLNDLHTDSLKEKGSKLIRQRSYTLLKPSPQLLAHLEVQSLNTGVEMTSISMSESLSNLSSPNKKRRSWDLESAKVKWSSMALELKTKNVPKANEINKNVVPKCVPSVKKLTSPPQAPRAKSVTQEKPRRATVISKPLPKSEPVQKAVKRPLSPVRNVPTTMSSRSNVKEPTSSKNSLQKKDATPKPLISESEDPASRLRELYEKIQKQQLAQMTTLVEKQKREQLLLQQVFEEQNNLLFKQLKTICPKSPIEAKEAWVDKVSDGADRGPVSLSQLINQQSPDQTLMNSPVSSTLTDTHNYINHCDDVLKKSRDITGSLKKQQKVPKTQGSAKVQSSKPLEGTRTRTQSPAFRNASRRLNYDTSVSSDRECDPILTDRTNDTLADLNVTFPSDYSDSEPSSKQNGIVSRPQMASHPSSAPSSALGNRQIEAAIRSMEESLINSLNKGRQQSLNSSKPQAFSNPPTAKEREAATKIVAHAKGFLVRRLMRTERIQSTVQTIRDALLCALQLHQDRAGIRGADVDLHRRLIQQITAACYSLHDAFVASTPAERCAMIAADRGRKRALATRQTPVSRPRSLRNSDIMTQSHSGSFPTRPKPPPPSLMTQSTYETFSTERLGSPRRRPWR